MCKIETYFILMRCGVYELHSYSLVLKISLSKTILQYTLLIFVRLYTAI